MRQLEEESFKLKCIVADLSLEKAMLQDALTTKPLLQFVQSDVVLGRQNRQYHLGMGFDNVGALVARLLLGRRITFRLDPALPSDCAGHAHAETGRGLAARCTASNCTNYALTKVYAQGGKFEPIYISPHLQQLDEPFRFPYLISCA